MNLLSRLFMAAMRAVCRHRGHRPLSPELTRTVCLRCLRIVERFAEEWHVVG